MATKTFDFSKGVNYKPLEEMGLTRQEAVSFLAAMAPMIDLEFQDRIQKAFTQEEMLAIGDEAIKAGIKPEDGMFFLEKKFHEKKGHYFMEEMRRLFNRYVVISAGILKKAKSDTEKFAEAGEDNVKNFNKLMDEKKWDEAAKMLDDTLKSSEKKN